MGYSCRTLLRDTLLRHSSGTLLRDTLVGLSSSSPDTPRTKVVLQGRQFSASSSTGQIALSPAFRALNTHDLRRGLRARGANRTLACISRTRHARSPHSCGTLLWVTCRTLLWDTLRKLLWDTLLGHSCGTLLWDTLVGHSCGILLSDTLKGHS